MTRTDPSTPLAAGPDQVPPGRPAGGTSAYREVRVHGIGDHGPLSAQGSGEVLPGDPGQTAAGITFSLPPPAPGHDARYLNWSRTSRSKVRLFWYVAFPYTLVNTAAFMCPRQGPGRHAHRVLVVVWGAVLTAATVLWVVAAAETALRFAAGGRGTTWASIGLPLAAGVVVPLVLAVRAVKHGGARRETAGWDVAPGTLAVNVLAAVGTLVAVATSMPARTTVPTRGGSGGAPCLLGPDGIDCVVYQGDWVTVAAFGTVSAAVLLLLVLAVASLVSQDTTWRGSEASPLLGTGVALLAATVLLHVGWSSFLIAAQALLGYLDGWYFLTVLDDPSGTHPADGLLLPFDAGALVGGQTQAGYVYGPHLVAIVLTAPVVLLVLLVAVAAGLRAVERVFAGGATGPGAAVPGLVPARRMHGWITATPGARLTALAFAGALGWVLWLVVVGRFLADPPPLGAPSGLIAFLIVMRHLLLVAFLLLVFVGSLRRPLAVVGDLVGFWNISAHPLAALPYRNVVVSAIRGEIARSGRLALVGHSQGSVLCFTALLERARAGGAGAGEPAGSVNGHVDLVTCGSPLASLYGRFFPRFFGATEMELVNGSVSSWRNFWRDTDPIATKVGAKDGDGQVPDPPAAGAPDEPGDRPLRRHGDYWIATEQTTWIRERATTAGLPLD